jgi:MarR family transcriptional regulator, lower aerobic nicotinate degradation pathway regulator
VPLDQLPPGPPTEVQIAFLLTRLGGQQSSAFAAALRPLELRPKQFAVMNLVALADGPSQQEIGATMELDPSGLIATLDELEERSWLERRPSERDRRRNALYLTRSGKKKLDAGRRAARARADELTEPLTAKERETLLRLLLKL